MWFLKIFLKWIRYICNIWIINALYVCCCASNSSLLISFVKLYRYILKRVALGSNKKSSWIRHLFTPGKAKAIPYKSYIWEIYPCTEVLISRTKILLQPRCIKHYLQIVKLAFLNKAGNTHLLDWYNMRLAHPFQSIWGSEWTYWLTRVNVHNEQRTHSNQQAPLCMIQKEVPRRGRGNGN